MNSQRAHNETHAGHALVKQRRKAGCTFYAGDESATASTRHVTPPMFLLQSEAQTVFMQMVFSFFSLARLNP